MKRLLVVLLIMCMAVSVCACGKKEEKEKYYKVGDTVSTDRAEVTMKESKFSEIKWQKSLKEENIEKDRIYYKFIYDLKNIGDTVLNDKMRNPDGYPYSNKLGAYVDLYYGSEKYVALNSDHYVLDLITGALSFNVPVGETYEITGCFELPRKAITDDEPIYVHIKLPNSEGEFEIFKFKLK